MRRTAFTRSSQFGAGKATIVDFEKRGERFWQAFRGSSDVCRLQQRGFFTSQRWTLSEVIGPMIASLLSEDNRWINAQRIEVSGGQGI